MKSNPCAVVAPEDLVSRPPIVQLRDEEVTHVIDETVAAVR
jgi:hypothetical protein